MNNQLIKKLESYNFKLLKNINYFIKNKSSAKPGQQRINKQSPAMHKNRGD